jgi:hypothetical protein
MAKYTLTDETMLALKAANVDKPLFKKTLLGNDFVFTIVDGKDQKIIDEYIKSNSGKVSVGNVDEKYVDLALKFPLLSPIEQQTLAAGVYPTLAE